MRDAMETAFSTLAQNPQLGVLSAPAPSSLKTTLVRLSLFLWGGGTPLYAWPAIVMEGKEKNTKKKKPSTFLITRRVPQEEG